jgi:hypothetical protein
MVGGPHGVQRALQRFGPVVEEMAKLRELRRKIVCLPEIENALRS